jgi:hypothetical protein
VAGSRTSEGTTAWWAAPAAAGGSGFAEHDWAATALGAPAGWPPALRATVSLLLAAPAPMALWWGPQAILIHNDAHGRIFGAGQGRPGAQAWPRRWARWGPVIERVRDGGAAASLAHRDLVATLSPVFADTGAIAGVLTIMTAAPDGAGDPAERERAVRRADALARLSAALSVATTGSDIVAAMALHAGAVVDATRARAGLLDAQRAVLTVGAHGPGDAAATVSELRADSPDALAVATDRDRTMTQTTPAAAGAFGLRSLTVPMRYNDGGLLGAVEVCWEPAATTDASGLGATRSVLDTIAGLGSQALQRVQLSEATERVAALAAQLSASHTTAQAVQAILVAAPQILGARLPSVALPDDHGRLRLWHHDLPAGLAEQYADLTFDDRRPIAEALRSRTRIVIEDRDAFRDRYPGLPDTAGAHGLTTTIAVPLLNHQGRPLAAIGMGWSRHRPLRTTDLALLDTITDLCEQTLERTRLAAAEHDLVTRLAGRVTTTPPGHPRFETAVRYEPALTGLNLGGDWYDVIALAGERLAVVVGDVVGHQVEAAADMAQLRTVLNTLVRLGTPLPEVFARVTDLLGRGFFGTAVVMVMEPGPGLMHVVRAGHPHPLLLPSTGPARVLHTPANGPLGMVTGPVAVSTTPFGPGDTILAYTDGLVERRTRSYDDGVEELRTVLAEAAGRPLDAIAEAVLRRIPGTEDDRALALVRRR